MLQLNDYWILFCMAFGGMLLTSFIMSMLSMNFFTWDVVKKKFSIMDLEFPATPRELVNVIKGLYKLPRPEALTAIKALRWRLVINFLFMPFAYGSIFFLCMLVSAKMTTFGITFFIILAWLQLIPWVCDIIENIYLLRKINPHPRLSKPAVHKTYLMMEIFKWGIALGSSICAIAAVFYFWLSRDYGNRSANFLLIIMGEIVLFVIFGKLFLKKKPKASS